MASLLLVFNGTLHAVLARRSHYHSHSRSRSHLLTSRLRAMYDVSGIIQSAIPSNPLPPRHVPGANSITGSISDSAGEDLGQESLLARRKNITNRGCCSGTPLNQMAQIITDMRHRHACHRAFQLQRDGRERRKSHTVTAQEYRSTALDWQTAPQSPITSCQFISQSSVFHPGSSPLWMAGRCRSVSRHDLHCSLRTFLRLLL